MVAAVRTLPTPRLLALAGQLAARLPLVKDAANAGDRLRQSTGLGAYLVVPSYGDVLVIARAGDPAPALWSLLPATESAGGSILLAYRQSLRDAQRPADDHTAWPSRYPWNRHHSPRSSSRQTRTG